MLSEVLVVWPRLDLLYSMLLICTFYTTGIQGALDDCKKTGPCSCKSHKGTIDLSPLALDDGAPKFKDVVGRSTGDVFSYNPCYEFTEGDCKGVAVCEMHGAPPTFFDIGMQNTAAFTTDQADIVSIKYSADTVNTMRTTVIILGCENETEGTLQIIGEVPVGSGNFYMHLRTKYACPTTFGGSPMLSVGSIMTIALAGILVGYIVIGLFVQTFINKAEGRNRLPNYSFWAGFPGYVKDGALFVVRRGDTKKDYSRI